MISPNSPPHSAHLPRPKTTNILMLDLHRIAQHQLTARLHCLYYLIMLLEIANSPTATGLLPTPARPVLACDAGRPHST